MIDNNTETNYDNNAAPITDGLESVSDPIESGADRDLPEGDTGEKVAGHLFLGIDGAATKAGLACMLVAPGASLLFTSPINTQGPEFYIDLWNFTKNLAKAIEDGNIAIQALDIYIECPPGGKFAYQIGRSVNFASGKIVGALGVFLGSLGIPVPRTVEFVFPVQWRKSVLNHGKHKYDKQLARDYAEKMIKPARVKEMTDDECEAFCICMYGRQKLFTVLSLLDTRKVH